MRTFLFQRMPALPSFVVAIAALGGWLAGPSPMRAQGLIDLRDGAVIARGEEVFGKTCAVGYCHGSAGRAARGPDLREGKYEPAALHAVVHDGIPGTTMPPWKGILPHEDIWAVVAYVLSISKSPVVDAQAAMVAPGGVMVTPVALSAEARYGRDLFFDATNERRCSVCHELGGVGVHVGPNLAAVARGKSGDELLRDIVEPSRSVAADYPLSLLQTHAGERVEGVVHGQGESEVRIYDTAAFPPVLRTFPRDVVATIETKPESAMPAFYSQIYTPSQLQAIVAFLRSAGQ